jgi:hypothetical protein
MIRVIDIQVSQTSVIGTRIIKSLLRWSQEYCHYQEIIGSRRYFLSSPETADSTRELSDPLTLLLRPMTIEYQAEDAKRVHNPRHADKLGLSGEL